MPFAGEFHHHHEESRGQIPGEEDEVSSLVDETFTWQNLQFGAGVRGVGSVAEKFRLTTGFVRWRHKELENETVATTFDNRLWSYRGIFEQKKFRSLSGRFGFQGSHRNYIAGGEEALTPPAASNCFALFALEELDVKSARFQFGLRAEHTAYHPRGLVDRSFTGFSGAAGIYVPIGNKALVANYTRAYRPPALEELYNNGPHVGNLAFEIGDPGLNREASQGIDLSLRYQTERVQSEANFYHYRLHDFVYLAFTGEVAHGLRVAKYAQADARFMGGEASFSVKAHSNLQLNFAIDAVRSALVEGNIPLPRTPPWRARLGFDAAYKAFSFRPEFRISARQSRIHPTETPTAGYALLDLTASYTYAKDRRAHFFSVSVLNAADRLYRNHVSFIKDLAPEMGRSIRFSYSFQIY